MKPSLVAMTIIFAIIFVAAVTGIYAGFRRRMNLEQWTTGGRGFGAMIIWLLMAGEIYTTFAFLGASGWAYSRGGPTLYILAYLTLSSVIGFFLVPRIWQMGSKFRLHTESDFFLQRYRNQPLASFVGIVGVIFIIPYLQLQLTGLGIIVQVASFGVISRTVSITIAFVIVAGFVLSSGVRAVAWVSVLKDALMIFAAFVIGIGIPYHYFGGVTPIFRQLAKINPSHLTMPGGTADHGHLWYVTTVLLTAVGGIAWPHTFGSIFTAKSANTLRRNAVVLPLYNLTLPLFFVVGFAAILIMPGLKNGDMALLLTVQKTFPPWLLGIVGGAGALTAMVPAAILILTAGTLFAKNFFRPLFAPSMSDDSVATLAKIMVVIITALAMYFALYSSLSLVALLLFAYSGITQFGPGVVLALVWKRANAAGVFAGLLVGVGLAMALTFTHHDPVGGINAGFLALCLNVLTTVVVSLATPAQPSGFETPVRQMAAAGQ